MIIKESPIIVQLIYYALISGYIASRNNICYLQQMRHLGTLTPLNSKRQS